MPFVDFTIWTLKIENSFSNTPKPNENTQILVVPIVTNELRTFIDVARYLYIRVH